MLANLIARFAFLGPGLVNGAGLGAFLIFLTLIGIPSDDSEELAALAVPLYLLVAALVGWRSAYARQGEALPRVLSTATLTGLVAGGVMLLFLGQINTWHADDINVPQLYFDKMNTYPVHILSGVPLEELDANPPVDTITQTYPPGTELRTNPLPLYIGGEYGLLGVPLGGIGGLVVWLGLASLAGGITRMVLRRTDWTNMRGSVIGQVESDRRGLLQDALHWLVLCLPLILFLVFWLTLPHTMQGGIFESLALERSEPLQIIDLTELLDIQTDSLIDEVTIQLGLNFLVIITAVVASRRVNFQPTPVGLPVRIVILGGITAVLYLLGLWRITANDVVFISPSFDFFGLSANEVSLLVYTLIAAGLVYLTWRGIQNPARWQVNFVTHIALAVVLMAPLFMNQYQTFIMGRVTLTIMLGLGLNIVIGMAGLLDLGYVAFYAVGAYTFAFIALENNRNQVSPGHLNDMGWLILTGFVIVPALIFALVNGWRRRQKEAPPPRNPRRRGQSKVWADQPPLLVTTLLVVFAVAVTLAVYSALERASVFPSAQVSSFLVAIPVAWLAAAVVGYALGVPVLRLRGDYLAIVTLGFGEISSLALRNLEPLTGGPAGAINFPKPLPEGAGTAVTNLTMLYIGIAGAALIMLASLNLRNSRVGRAWLAMKSDEDIAQAMGINLVNVKLLAFTIGSSFGGLAGLLFGSRQNSVYPEDFELQVSINIISVVIIGGMGSVPGVILGAIALVGLPELLRPINDYRIMAFGLLLIVSMVTLPRGLMPAPPPELEDKARALAEAQQAEAQQEEEA